MSPLLAGQARYPRSKMTQARGLKWLESWLDLPTQQLRMYIYICICIYTYVTYMWSLMWSLLQCWDGILILSHSQMSAYSEQYSLSRTSWWKLEQIRATHLLRICLSWAAPAAPFAHHLHVGNLGVASLASHNQHSSIPRKNSWTARPCSWFPRLIQHMP